VVRNNVYLYTSIMAMTIQNMFLNKCTDVSKKHYSTYVHKRHHPH